MTWTEIVAWAFGIEDVESIGSARPSFAAAWAHDGPAWVLFGCLALSGIALVAYLRLCRPIPQRSRVVLSIGRAVVLCLLFLAIADPVLTVSLLRQPRPLLGLLIDGTDSMSIEDEVADGPLPVDAPNRKVARIDRVRKALEGPQGLIALLAERFRLRAFLFDRPDLVRVLDWTGEPGTESALTAKLSAKGQVTAIGAAFEDLLRRHFAGGFSGLLVFSDFNQNAGTPAVPAAIKLGVPVYPVGVGQPAPVDLALDMQAPLVMKKAERSIVRVVVRQTGLAGRSAALRLTMEPVGKKDGEVLSGGLVAERKVELNDLATSVEIPFVPTETGRFLFRAVAEPLSGESITENNSAAREVTIRDDFLRISFIEHEPTWEWRFVKEVFHRDPLVGMRGFRTFLRSADPKVRQANELFLPTLTPPRGEFFANDVIFLGDMPASALSTRFCELLKEFVSKFGGGLVVLSGPRFGPGQLASTPLAELLPVIPEPTSRFRDSHEFKMRLSEEALQTDFMRLGSDDAESVKAWENLGPLLWYQPVARLHPLATSLAQHPSDTCTDGKTPQPLIAMRRYGAGDVVYLAFNETWRLRRKYGEHYYRQFWGQMIHRLGMSHTLGAQKRFVARTDRQQYQADDRVVFTVEAYDANFEPLKASDLPDQQLAAEFFKPRGGASEEETTQQLLIPQLREGVFEAHLPVFESGEYRLRVKDPVAETFVEVTFQVSSVSIERRSPLRNTVLEAEIASATGGKAYEVAALGAFPDEVKLPARKDFEVRVLSLWNNWILFGLVVGLLILEWLHRRLVHLP